MKLHITLTLDDYIAFNIAHAFRSPAQQKNLRIGRLMPAMISLFFVLLFLACGMRGAVLWAEIAALAIVAAVGYFRYPKTYENSIRKHILKLKEEGRLPYAEESDVAFGEDAMTEAAPNHTNLIPYSDLLDVWETDEHFFVMFGALQAIIIPKRCVDDPQLLSAFLSKKAAGAQA